MLAGRMVSGSVLVAVLMAGGLLFGEQQPSTKGKKTLPLYWSKLGLSEDQKKKVYAIQLEYREKIEPLRAQITRLEEEQKRELAKILTEPQREELRKILATKSLSEPPVGKAISKTR